VAITRVLAQSTVSDLAAAEHWYTRVFGREPDLRPMPGLLEWHLGETFGVQVWSEPDRAGHSSMVLDESDVDAIAARLNNVGIVNDGPQKATTSRILALTDPDGNRLVFTGSLA
jgi:catechol 2,3-dioxygenase-like lactoylglutathione lyase family enzyme